METALTVEPECCDGIDYFTFQGTIDANAEKQLKDIPGKVSNPLVKFDFSRTGRINSMGIALLLRCLKTIKDEKKAEIRLVRPNPMNTMLFRMTGVLLLAQLDN